MRATIAGIGAALPSGRLTNEELERRVDTSSAWIVERTGIRERRVATSGETTATLGVAAGADAIKHAGLTPDAIDLLVLATATPEQPIPHTGAFVSDRLGLRCGSFDLAAGCAGFVYALVVGSSLVVYPAADIPLVAARSGARLIVINAEPTPFDELAAVVIRGKSGEVLPQIVELIGG